MQSPEAVSAVGKLSYNQLVEKIITCKHSSDTNLVTEGELPCLSCGSYVEGTKATLIYCSLSTCPAPPHHIPLEGEFGEHISLPSAVPGRREVATQQLCLNE